MELETGKLYQVYHWDKGWIIAEYRGKTEAHIVTGFRSDGTKSWREAASHKWNTVVGKHWFRVFHKDLQIRPVTEETLVEIGRLRGEITRLQSEVDAVRRELRELAS